MITSVTLAAGWNTKTGCGCSHQFRGEEMTIQEAKGYVGTQLEVEWTGRNGNKTETVHVLSVDFVPFYGPCLITDLGEISLERVVGFTCIDQRAAA